MSVTKSRFFFILVHQSTQALQLCVYFGFLSFDPHVFCLFNGLFFLYCLFLSFGTFLFLCRSSFLLLFFYPFAFFFFGTKSSFFLLTCFTLLLFLLQAFFFSGALLGCHAFPFHSLFQIFAALCCLGLSSKSGLLALRSIKDVKLL